MKKVFLVGNPNVGKSVLFSRITGVDVIVSNYPGTTVEIAKNTIIIGDEKVEVVDLPGIYSLESSSKAEEVTVTSLSQHPKESIIVINVVDATNLERNLYLTLQLIEQGFSMIVCLNMCDEMEHHGVEIDIKKLQNVLEVPALFTCGVTGKGIKPLLQNLSTLTAARKSTRTNQERWAEIGRIIQAAQVLRHRHHTFRELLEDASLRPFSGFLIAGAIVYISFQAVRLIAGFLIKGLLNPLFNNVYRPLLESLSAALGHDGFMHHLLIGDLVKGGIDFERSLGILTTAPYIELVMVLPYIVAFYFVLSFLEDMGFLPRLAVLLDNLFHRIGLHGYAIIPVLLGFGCNVPGIIASRMLESKRERFIVSTLISIGIPCAAQQAMIFGLLGSISGYYVLGVNLVLFLVWLVLGRILNRMTKGYSPEFFMEIPPYRMPPMHLLFKKLAYRVKVFLIEAFPVVLVGILCVNVLLYTNVFDKIATLTAPVVSGLFGLPKQAIVALAMGIVRKDIAQGLLLPLGLNAKQLFIATVLLAVSFPCFATFIIFLKELGLRALIKAMVIMCAVTLVLGVLLNFLVFR